MNLLKIVMREKVRAEDKGTGNMLNINEVFEYSFKKHKGQVRPNTKREPKIIHIAQVAMLVKNAGGSIEAIAAAYLHDIIEDTDTTLKEIEVKFGKKVALLVYELTDPPDFKAMPLKIRKQKQADKMQFTQFDTKLIKIADQISNINSVLIDPPLDWNNTTCLEYINGAKKIVDACLKTNEFLEKKFMKIYDLAITKYSIILN